MAIDICVRSRGVGPLFDYSWVALNSKNFSDENYKQMVKLEELIDPDQFSIVVMRHSSDIFMLINKLGSRHKKDYQQRFIAHSIFLIAHASRNEDEAKLRGLIVALLRQPQEVMQEVDHFIETDATTSVGFAVNPQLAQYLMEFKATDKQNPSKEILVKKANDLATSWKTIADEVDQHHFPTDNRILVVVTGIKDAKYLRDAKVWRGITTFDSEPEIEKKKGCSLGCPLKATILLLPILSLILIVWIMLKAIKPL